MTAEPAVCVDARGGDFVSRFAQRTLHKRTNEVYRVAQSSCGVRRALIPASPSESPPISQTSACTAQDLPSNPSVWQRGGA